ncbi:DUF106 domain-containing protein [Candidatus Micrarchaeota archaeon]|nr:DUF106 domain-containing protein [Candidatus Micrarchaeota archaeon]
MILLQVIPGIDDTITLIILTLFFSILTNLLGRRFGSRSELRRIQKEINEWNASLRKAQKEKNEPETNRLLAKNTEMMEKMSKMTMLSFKSLIITLPLFILVFSVILPTLFPTFTILLPFDIHFDALLALNILRDSTYGPKGFFIVCTIPFGLAIETILNKIEDNKNK